jgi:hypothetical protein
MKDKDAQVDGNKVLTKGNFRPEISTHQFTLRHIICLLVVPVTGYTPQLFLFLEKTGIRPGLR